MPLWSPSDYDPEPRGGDVKEHPPGEYAFKVNDVEERFGANAFESGSGGVSIHLLVAVDRDTDITVYETIVTDPAPGKKDAKWKLQSLTEALDMDPRHPWEARDYIGKRGRAFFHRQRGSKYLSVKYFVVDGGKVDQPAPAPSMRAEFDYGPPPMDDDVPF